MTRITGISPVPGCVNMGETPAIRPDSIPVRNELLFIFGTAVVLRVLIFLTASTFFDIPFDTYVRKGDGESYVAYAKAIWGDSFGLREYDRRVFPGYPLLIAAVNGAGVPVGIAALGIDWISAGLAAAFSAMLFQDRRVGWAMVMLIPHWMINSSLAMSEAPLLAITLAGLLLAQRHRSHAAGLMLGFAGLVRPMACFAVIGAMFNSLLRRRWPSALTCGIAAAAVVLAGVVGMQLWTGDALQGARIYANDAGTYRGKLWMWPFQSLLTTPFRESVPIGIIIYVGLHVALTLTACIILVRRWINRGRELDERDAISLPWLVGNTLFVLCIGSTWGFYHFPRFTIPAMPAMFWATRAFLPQRWIWWAVIGAGSFVVGVNGVYTSP